MLISITMVVFKVKHEEMFELVYNLEYFWEARQSVPLISYYFMGGVMYFLYRF